MPVAKPNPMNIVTEQMVHVAAPETKIPAAWAKHFDKFLPQYGITTKADIAMFLGQTAHESGGYTRLDENLNYSADGLIATWPKRYTRTLANAHARKPELIANHVYSGRMGNINPGDGWRFKGKGIIQLTGRDNHTAFGKTIGKSAEEARVYLESAEGMVHAACWFWKVNNLSAHQNNVEQATQIINNGQKGIEDRKRRYSRVMNLT